MMIERVYIHNFRCLENFSVDLASRSSALIIGKNGCGKSTFKNALAVFQKICRRAGRVGDLIASSDFTQQRTQIPMRFEMDLLLDQKQFSYAISFELPENFREARIAEEKLSVDGNDIFTRSQTQVTLSGGQMFRLDWHVPALPVINERPSENSIQRITSFFGSMLLLSPVPGSMSGFSEDESFELEQDASNLSAWFNGLLLRFPAAYHILYSYLKSLMPDLQSFENLPRGERGKQLLVKFENEQANGSLTVDFKHLSDGEKCFFLSALILAANKVSGPVFCLWDEPDSHLSLSEVSHFITELKKISNQKGQFLATSHHPSTIRSFSGDATLVFLRKSHLEPTIVRPLSEIEYRGDLIEALVRGEVYE